MTEQSSNDATPLIPNGVYTGTEQKRVFYVHYMIATMCLFGYTLVYLMRFNLSIAITVMVKKEQVYSNISSNTTLLTGDETLDRLDWDVKTQQMVLGAFFYGYAVMPLPAGYLANRVGGKILVGFSVLWTSVMTALVPWSATTNVGILVFVRILDGIGQSALVPGIFQIVQKWSPQNELTTMLNVACSGKFIGLILSGMLSPLLCSSTLLGGWPLSFYVYSCMGFIWTMVWVVWGSDSPETYQWKSSPEAKQFYNSIPDTRKSEKTKCIPWRQMVTSYSVWALVIGNFGHSLGLNLWLTNIPLFVTTTFELSLLKSGWISSLGFGVQLVMSIGLSIFSDWVLSNGHIEVNTLRKCFVFLGLGVTSMCTIIIGFVDDGLLIFMLVCCLGFYSCTTTGILPIPLDIAPNFSAIISGAMNITANASGFVGTLILGTLLDTKKISNAQWRNMFFIIAAFQIFGLFVFLIFGSAKQQHWAKGDEDQQHEMLDNNK